MKNIISLALLAALLLSVQPASAAPTGVTIGGEDTLNSLRITTFEDGTMSVEKCVSLSDGCTWEDQIAESDGDHQKASFLWIDGIAYQLGQNGYLSSQTAEVIPVNNNGLDAENVIETTFDLNDFVRITRYVRYTRGTNFFRTSWEIDNRSENPFSSVKLIEAQTMHSGSGSGFFRQASHAIGLIGQESQQYTTSDTHSYDSIAAESSTITQLVTQDGLMGRVHEDSIQSAPAFALSWKTLDLEDGNDWRFSSRTVFATAPANQIQVTADPYIECYSGEECEMVFSVRNIGDEYTEVVSVDASSTNEFFLPEARSLETGDEIFDGEERTVVVTFTLPASFQNVETGTINLNVETLEGTNAASVYLRVRPGPREINLCPLGAGQGRFASYVVNTEEKNGEGFFTPSSQGRSDLTPNFTFSWSGGSFDDEGLESDEGEDFENQNNFVRIFGDPSDAENLKIDVKGSEIGEGGENITNETVLKITFDQATSSEDMAIAITDLDVEQVEITAEDAMGNPVSAEEISYWERGTFDPEPSSEGINRVGWDEKQAAFTAASTGIQKWLTQTEPDYDLSSEAAAGWIRPGTSLKSLTLRYQVVNDEGGTAHVFVASCEDEVAVPTATPTSTATATPTVTNTPVPTITPTAVATGTATKQPTPVVTATAAPTATPLPVGAVPPPEVAPSPNDESATSDPLPVVKGAAIAGAKVEVYLNGELVGDTTAGPDGSWALKLTKSLPSGENKIDSFQTVKGVRSSVSNTVSLRYVPLPLLDFDGDGVTDITSHKKAGGAVFFRWAQSTDGSEKNATVEGARAIPGDYLGNGKTQPATASKENGSIMWRIFDPATQVMTERQFGEARSTVIANCRLLEIGKASLAYVKNGKLSASSLDGSIVRTVGLTNLNAKKVVGCGDLNEDGYDEVFLAGKGALMAVDMKGTITDIRKINKRFSLHTVRRPGYKVANLVSLSAGISEKKRQVTVIDPATSAPYANFKIPALVNITAGIFRNEAGEQASGIFWSQSGKRKVVRKILGVAGQENVSFKLKKRETLTRSFNSITFK